MTFPENPFELIGLVAGLLTTFAYLPQIIQVWKTKSVEDISLGMYVVAVSGVCLWMIYGYLIDSFSLLMWNIVTFGMTLSLLIMKLYWSKGKNS